MKLTATYERAVAFHDLDPMSVVWHGNYVAFMEEARECFLEKYAMRNLQLGTEGYILPVTRMELRYIKSFRYDDVVVVEVEYIPCRKAMVQLSYRMYRKSDGELMCEATTEHHFVEVASGSLAYSRPQLYKDWQQRWQVFDE